MEEMKCPHCGKTINAAALLGAEGGKKSRRKLTPEQAKAMVDAREKKRRAKLGNNQLLPQEGR